jgi:hypothetical protein
MTRAAFIAIGLLSLVGGCTPKNCAEACGDRGGRMVLFTAEGDCKCEYSAFEEDRPDADER